MAIYVTDSAGKRTMVAGIGLPGPTGKSAYQYAVEGGFVGTEDEFKALLAGISNEDVLVNDYFADPIDQQNGYIVPEGTPYYQLGVVDSPVVGTLTAPVTVKRFYNTNGAPIFDLGGTEYYSAIGTEVRGYCGSGYTIDMWRMDAGTGAKLQIMDGFIRGTSLVPTETYHAIDQTFEVSASKNLAGKTVTLSCLHRGTGNFMLLFYDISKGVAIKNLAFGPCENWTVDSLTFTLPTDLAQLRCCEYFDVSEGGTGYTDFKATKFELGSKQTLAHKVGDTWVLNAPPPNRALELLKCQLYYWESEASFSGTYYNADWITLNQKFPVRMRCVPTITILSLSGTENTFSDGNGNDTGVQTTISGSITREGIMSIGTTINPNGQGGTYNYRIIADARL